MAVTTERRARAWADLPPDAMTQVLEQSQWIGWRQALDSVAGAGSPFARRLGNLGLGTWHMLLLAPRTARALDVGCGYGSLSLGLAEYYREAVGIEPLEQRVSFAALRARQEGSPAAFLQGGGHDLPFEDGSFGLVTMNGVLEWAALFREGPPEALQVSMLREARRVLRPDGHVAVAIENRFALETLLGLRDTHTGLHGVPALPRAVADRVMRWRKGEPYRTYLYSRRGYERLLHRAGYAHVRVLDLVSSYNDYDFIVDPRDAASYRFLYRHGLVSAFYPPAGRARGWLSHAAPRLLGEVSYAYLVIGSRGGPTALETGHHLWHALRGWGIEPGRYRFACRGARPNELAIVCHDGTHVRTLVELGDGIADAGRPSLLPERIHRRLTGGLAPWKTGRVFGTRCRVWRMP
ncbi:MAG TPA: class I SAM-dependent methyltransferase [Gemmatimonadales bacterium]|nr:class I SAM-dependent methyltransferase [Gemmatimonadales bacterium]